MRTRAVSFLALSAAMASIGSACSSTPPPGGTHYEEYTCPAPIGQIVREDCSQLAQRYDGMISGAAQAGASGDKAQALREADSVLATLKEQRVSLCNDFNTCKLTVDQYRNEKQRVESSFTAVVALKGQVDKLDASAIAGLMDQLRDIRSGKPPSATPPPPPPQANVPTPPPPPPPAPAPTTGDDWQPGRFMVQAVGRVADAARNIEAKTNFGFDVDHACLLGAYLQVGKAIDIVQSFKGGREYVLVGGGSDNAIDVDLGVLEGGKVLAADTDDDPTPIVKFKPPKDGNYTIRLLLEKSKSSGNFVALAVMHEGGYTIPHKNIVASIGGAIRSASLAAKKVNQKGASLTFHEGGGDWSFYGTVLKPQEMSTFGGIKLTTDPTIALAGADEDGTNIDLLVKDQGSGALVAKDVEPDATPAVLVHPQPSSRYSLSVANAARQGTTLATVLLLDVKN